MKLVAPLFFKKPQSKAHDWTYFTKVFLILLSFSACRRRKGGLCSPVPKFDVGVNDVDPLGHDHFAGVVLHAIHLNMHKQCSSEKFLTFCGDE